MEAPVWFYKNVSHTRLFSVLRGGVEVRVFLLVVILLVPLVRFFISSVLFC